MYTFGFNGSEAKFYPNLLPRMLILYCMMQTFHRMVDCWFLFGTEWWNVQLDVIMFVLESLWNIVSEWKQI